MATQCIIHGSDSHGTPRCLMVRVVDDTKPGLRPGAQLTRTLVHVFLALAMFLAILASLSAAVPALLGLKDMIVTSGSMEPAMSAGDVAMIRPLHAEPIQVGDLITFRTWSASGMTTHRVIAIKSIDGHAYFQTKGDANNSPDADLVPGEAVFGKVVWVEPKVGYLLVFGTTMWGKALMIILPLVLALVLEGWDLLRPKKPRHTGQHMERLGGHRGASMPS